MHSNKRTASEASLPFLTPEPKHPRMDSKLPKKESRESLKTRWFLLLKDTFAYPTHFFAVSEEAEATEVDHCPESSTQSSFSDRSQTPQLSHISSLPPTASSSTLHHPLATPTAMTYRSRKAPSSTASLLSDSRLSFASSRESTATTPSDRLHDALRSPARAQQLLQANFPEMSHIYARQHREQVSRSLSRRLYEMAQTKGYRSGYETFKEYLTYRTLLLSKPHKRIDVSDETYLPESLLNRVTGADFQKAVERARKSYASVGRPRFSIPNLEQLQITIGGRDSAISKRLHSKKTLPKTLPPDAQKEVEALLAKKGIVSKLVKEQVTNEDLARLRPSQWLNDELINFYGQMIMNRAAEAEAGKENATQKCLKVHYFNTFFWSKIKQGYEKSRLAKWTKKIDIFTKDVILIPVNHNNSHWTAAAINFRRKRIESYDSMNIDRREVYAALRQYLDDEHKNKKKKPFDFKEWQDWVYEDTPQQENGYDCGVFTCQFLETLSRGEEEFIFTQSNMPFLRQRMIWEIGRGKLADR